MDSRYEKHQPLLKPYIVIMSWNKPVQNPNPVPLCNAETCRRNGDNAEQSAYRRLSRRARTVEANESNCDEERYDTATCEIFRTVDT